MKPTPTVCVIGIWHLGAVNAAGFAEKGYRVIGLEKDPKKAQRLQKGKQPELVPGEKMKQGFQAVPLCP